MARSKRFPGARAAGPLIVALAMTVTACAAESGPAPAAQDNSDVSSFEAPDDSGLTPTPGGTLRIGTTGGGQTEQLNPNSTAAAVDFGRASAMYERLTGPDGKGGVEYILAEKMTPNEDAGEWTVHLRKGVTFTDGSELDADDVLFSWKEIVENEWKGALMLDLVDLDATERVDDHTIRVVLKKPNVLFPRLVGSEGVSIVPDGMTDFAEPNGTGPFDLVSFTPGDRSVMKRKENYWRGEGRPYLETLEIISLAGSEAGVNALKGGQIDVLAKLPFEHADAVGNDPRLALYNQPGAIAPSFSFRVDKEPFTDVRVRQAMKLAIDRERCVTVGLRGYGEIGNDLVGPGSDTYAKDLPQRPYDPEKAKSLLKEAGHDSIDVTLTVGPASPGMVECAQVFEQSAKPAGINIKLQQIPASDVYNFGAGYGTRTFGMTEINGRPFETYVLTGLLAGARNNDTHYDDPELAGKYDDAVATLDDGARREKFVAMQAKARDEGGFIVWGHKHTLFGVDKRVRGLADWLAPNPDLNPYKRLDLVWLDAK